MGGISELISGHYAIWENGQIKLTHNPSRRDVGKIYTPYDVTNYMCEFIVSNMVSQSNSLEDLVKMKVLEPAIGSGAFLAQFVRTLYREARQKWEITDSCKFK